MELFPTLLRKNINYNRSESKKNTPVSAGVFVLK
jgi:hypothetical protein